MKTRLTTLLTVCLSLILKAQTATFFYTPTAPGLDGIADDAWEKAVAFPIKQLIDGKPSEKFGAWFKGMYDDKYLYLYVNIQDTTEKLWEKDAKDANHDMDEGELYFDFNYTRPDTYFDNRTTAFEFFRGSKKLIDTHKGSTGNIEGEVNAPRFWTQEFRIPLTNLKINTPEGHIFGFDIHINDGDKPGPRQRAIAWSDTNNTSFKNPRMLGSITLAPKSAPKSLPFYISDNGHFFQYKNGNPFFWLACTGWRTFAGTSKEQIMKYFDTRKAQGFNLIQVFYTMSWAETNGNGDSAFINNDPLQLNPAYLEYAKWCTREADSRGFALIIVLGDVFRHDTRFKRIEVEKDAYQYGHNLGIAFKDFSNIVWGMGQDFEGVRNSLWRAAAEGIHDALQGTFKFDGAANWDNALVTYHIGWEQSSSIYFQNEPWLDFNLLQSSHNRRDNHHVYIWPWMDWEKKPVKPVIEAEPNYENHPVWQEKNENAVFTDLDIRKVSYRAVFAGSCGITYGANHVWQIDANWLDCLNYPGALQMVYLKNLMLSRPYFEREPDKFMVLSVNPNDPSKIIGTVSAKGNYAMLYIPGSGQEFLVDLSKIKGERIKTWWYNPENGKTYNSSGMPSDKPDVINKSDTMKIKSPVNKESVDWVLVIDSELTNYLIPGSVK